MSVRGIWQNESTSNSFCLCEAEEVANSSGPLSAALAACHSLTTDTSTLQVVGDPLDRVIFLSTNWVSCLAAI